MTAGTEQKTKKNGYYYHRIPIKVESRKLQKTGHFGKPFEFEKVKIIWDDGSSSTEQIGTIRITDGKKRNGLKRSESGQMHADKGWIQYTDYQVKKNMKIIHMEIPFEKEKGISLPQVAVNAVSAQAIDKKHPLKLHRGELCLSLIHIFKTLIGKHRLKELSVRHNGKAAVTTMICHGGTIAAIMEKSFPGRKEHFYKWIPDPGHGYTLTLEDGKIVDYGEF